MAGNRERGEMREREGEEATERERERGREGEGLTSDDSRGEEGNIQGDPIVPKVHGAKQTPNTDASLRASHQH